MCNLGIEPPSPPPPSCMLHRVKKICRAGNNFLLGAIADLVAAEHDIRDCSKGRITDACGWCLLDAMDKYAFKLQVVPVESWMQQRFPRTSLVFVGGDWNMVGRRKSGQGRV